MSDLKKKKKPSHHCYLIPYTRINGKLEVLIGKKLFYSSRDGFIHNNPGQYVFVGGHCKKNESDDKLIDSSIREFVEETGNYVDKKNTFLEKYSKFLVTFYHVMEHREYKQFKVLTKKAIQGKHKELSSVKWVPIKDAIYLMNFKNNLPFDGKLNLIIPKYINEWKDKRSFKNEKWLLTAELQDFDSRIDKEEIRKNLKKSKNYKKLVEHIKEYVTNRSYIDWFATSIKFLKNNIEKIDYRISKNIEKIIRIPLKLNLKSSPTPQLFKKKSKKKYIAPHKRVHVSKLSKKSSRNERYVAPVKRSPGHNRFARF